MMSIIPEEEDSVVEDFEERNDEEESKKVDTTRLGLMSSFGIKSLRSDQSLTLSPKMKPDHSPVNHLYLYKRERKDSFSPILK